MEYNNQPVEGNLVPKRPLLANCCIAVFIEQFSRFISSEPVSQYIKVDLELTLKKEQTGQVAMVKTLKIISVT